jgi:crotonobetaine/carnitine-CoA ligase
MPILNLDDPADRVLGKVLLKQAEQRPDATYLISGNDRYSYGEVNELANAYAAGLAGLGVKPGDTVAFLMKSCVEFVFATFGAMKLGAVWVPTNTDYKGHWLQETLSDSCAKLLIADADLLPRVAELSGALPFDRIIVRGEAFGFDFDIQLNPIEELTIDGGSEPDQSEISFGDTAAVLWTSGTTGRSKGVMQSHNAWIRGAISGAVTSGTRDDDLMYCCLPMYNSAAWVANVYRALVCGLPVAIDSEFSASTFWKRCAQYGATQTFTLGAMHMFLWNAPEKPDDRDNPVRHASMVPLPDALIQPMKDRFGIETIDQGYGQSEAMGIFQRSDDGTVWAPGSLGRVLPGIEAALLDDDDRPVATGEVGEICARPTEPYVLFNGYFNNPEATVRAFRNLWYHTGDLGKQDEAGNYYFVDRKADFIRYKGRNISSFAVEAAINAHPAVAQSAAHGVTSAELDSEAEVKACVVLKPGAELDPAELARFVNDNAPYFFVPRFIEVMEALPSTPTGRVQKFKLRERGVTPATWDGKKAGFQVRRE